MFIMITHTDLGRGRRLRHPALTLVKRDAQGAIPYGLRVSIYSHKL